MRLTNVSLVLSDRLITNGTLTVDNGFITEVSESPGMPSGFTVYPGFIDIHGDMIEQELEPRIKVDFPIDVALNSLDARLAAAGVTTAYAAVSFSRGAEAGQRRSFEHTCHIIRSLKAAKNSVRVDHRIHARFDITYTFAIDALQGLLNENMVDLVSVMDHTPGQGQYRNIERHSELRAAHYGITIEEARTQIQDHIDKALPVETVLQNLQTVSALCRKANVPLASHDDDTIEKAHLIADLGAVISEFPVTIEAARTVIERNLMTAMGAPNAMRGKSYSGNLSAREAHAAGLLHILAADYHPASILSAIHALKHSDPDGLPGAVRLASLNPAKALGLQDRGDIAIGKRADLVVVDNHQRVAMTIRSGEVIYSNGVFSF